MKWLISAALCFCMQFTIAQKLDITTLEKITYSSIRSVDSLLKRSNFVLSDRQVSKDYVNYYYTSYERKDLFEHMLRSLSYMDVYNGPDTARLLLYRTYYKNDQEELKKQLLANGYELKQRIGNNYVYEKDGFRVTNKITNKQVVGGRSKTAYEFEMGR
jgi:hypothetical protein